MICQGDIRLYSKTHSAEYLRCFRGHSMAVYRVRWNPFHSDIFISCGADWMVHLWRRDNIEPLMTFKQVIHLIFRLFHAFNLLWLSSNILLFSISTTACCCRRCCVGSVVLHYIRSYRLISLGLISVFSKYVLSCLFAISCSACIILFSPSN